MSDRAAALEALRALYAELADAIAAHGPVCELSGRCCRFASYGHDLFVTDLELALLEQTHGPPPIAPTREMDGCPYQDGLACGARDGRPLGCRVYFCDPAYEETHMPGLAQRFHQQLQALHKAHGVPYRYGELRRMLAERFATRA